MNRSGKKCVLYPRVSTEMQVDGFSLDGQKNSLKRFADREEMEIVNIYDLDIVTRECNSSEEFVQYMIFRQMNIEKLSAMDELDFFGYFKKHGVNKITLDADEVWAISYTDEYDKKYYALTMKWLADFHI